LLAILAKSIAIAILGGKSITILIAIIFAILHLDLVHAYNMAVSVSVLLQMEATTYMR